MYCEQIYECKDAGKYVPDLGRCLYVWVDSCTYGVATISRLLKIIGLFCKRAL